MPWPDETSFIAPAFALARHHTLFVWAMNPDRLVMWMPPGYFLFLAVLFKIFGYSFTLVRWASAGCVIGSAVLCGWLVRRSVSGGWAVFLHFATVIAFLSPHVLMSANIGRMEALLCLVMLSSLLACLAGLPVLGAAIVAASATIHFNAVYFTLPYGVYFAWLLLTRRRLIVQPLELAGLAVAAAILGCYGLLVRENITGFIDDIHFQFQLKRFFGHDDPIHPLWPLLVAGAASFVVLLRQRKIDAAALVALYGTAFVLMATQGKEIWYDCAPPLGFLLILVSLAMTAPFTWAIRRLSMICVGPCLASLLAVGFTPTIFLVPLLPQIHMLTQPLLRKADIKTVRAVLENLAPATKVQFAWGGVEPFFFDALDKSGARWAIQQHSVTDNTLDRRADWIVICDSGDVPDYARRYYPHGPLGGCSIHHL